MTSRRDFLKRLMTATVAVGTIDVVDWDRLLWTPRQMVTVAGFGDPNIAELNAITFAEFAPAISDEFFKSTPLLQYFRDRGLTPSSDYTPIVSPLYPVRENLFFLGATT